MSEGGDSVMQTSYLVGKKLAVKNGDCCFYSFTANRLPGKVTLRFTIKPPWVPVLCGVKGLWSWLRLLAE